MPDGSMSTVFSAAQRPATRFPGDWRAAERGQVFRSYRGRGVPGGSKSLVPVWVETFDDDHSYFKFNLDTINLYSLIRLEGYRFLPVVYRRRMRRFCGTTAMHQNAHFNMIDRALKGPDEARDAEHAALSMYGCRGLAGIPW